MKYITRGTATVGLGMLLPLAVESKGVAKSIFLKKLDFLNSTNF
jgi:hypothetical protein